MTDSFSGLTIGVLGIQGCFAPHVRMLKDFDCEVKRVVYPADLHDVDGLILPGGESTTMLKGMTDGLWEAIAEHASQRPVWGICAGCILMASHVRNPEQKCLSLLDVDVVRNAYGAQNESFVASITVDLGFDSTLEAVFIRAPIIERVGDEVAILAKHKQSPVLIEQGKHLVATFHPELTACNELHGYFLRKVAQSR